MRNNIFQILQEHFDLHKEISRIQELFQSDLFEEKGVVSCPCSPEKLVDQYAFYDWKHRNRCINLSDLKDVLGIKEILNCYYPNTQDVITYLEYVENVLYLAWNYIENEDGFEYYYEYNVLKENIKSLLDHFNLETHYFDKDEMAIIVEKNEKSTAVAEIVRPELSLKVVKYNHHTLKGEIDKKKEIILALSDCLEPKRRQLEKLNRQLASDLFYMLNNLNLRHNNKDAKGKNYQPLVSKMRKNTIEKWYDEVYQLELLAFLLLDNEKRTKNIQALKCKMEEAKNA